ncbi:MAG: hypothetical protein AAGF01_00050 [Cyanobacteria bacterium P01_G01_bin.38]
MELYERLEQIIVKLRPAFSREAPFEWFVILLWGVLLTTQPAAVTSYLNAVGLGESFYHRALHWFSSSAFRIDDLCYRWGRWLREHPQTRRLKGQRVYVGDGIKVSKEGRKMPGVKRLHQESEDVSKPEWIRGHYFSALGLLLGVGQALFAAPIIFKLDDGIKAVEIDEPPTLVEKMATLCVEHMVEASYVVLDAYYASTKVLKPFRENDLYLISRARITTVVHAAFSRLPGKHGPGRPRKWGSKVKLRDLFAPLEECLKTSVWLYGQQETVYYQCFEFYWDTAEALVLFVLTQLPNGKQIILLSSDVNLTGQQVIEAYGWRFKIEVSFRTLVHLLGGFGYRFWLKSMATAARWPKNLPLVDYPESFQRQVTRKVEAFERFINLNAIALGLLQVLALEMPQQVWAHFPVWFRTLPKHGYPSEQIVRLSLQSQHPVNLFKSTPALLLNKFLVAKLGSSQTPDEQTLAA